MSAFKVGDKVRVKAGREHVTFPWFNLDAGKVYTVAGVSEFGGLCLDGRDRDLKYHPERFEHVPDAAEGHASVSSRILEIARVLITRQGTEIRELTQQRDEYKAQLKLAMHANKRKRAELRLQAEREQQERDDKARERSGFWGGFFL